LTKHSNRANVYIESQYKSMTDNHEKPNDESHALDFMQAFDGNQPEITAEEQRAVTAKFDTFVDDIMLSHAEDVHNTSKRPEAVVHMLELDIPAEDGTWSASVRHAFLQKYEANKFNSPKHSNKMVALVFTDVDGHEQGEFIYETDNDGVVCRSDSNNAGIEEEQNEEELFKDSDEKYANEDLEADMGLNDQPIGLGELDGLISFLTSPYARPAN
jgi:hypothetical protein